MVSRRKLPPDILLMKEQQKELLKQVDPDSRKTHEGFLQSKHRKARRRSRQH